MSAIAKKPGYWAPPPKSLIPLSEHIAELMAEHSKLRPNTSVQVGLADLLNYVVVLEEGENIALALPKKNPEFLSGISNLQVILSGNAARQFAEEHQGWMNHVRHSYQFIPISDGEITAARQPTIGPASEEEMIEHFVSEELTNWGRFSSAFTCGVGSGIWTIAYGGIQYFVIQAGVAWGSIPEAAVGTSVLPGLLWIGGTSLFVSSTKIATQAVQGEIPEEMAWCQIGAIAGTLAAAKVARARTPNAPPIKWDFGSQRGFLAPLGAPTDTTYISPTWMMALHRLPPIIPSLHPDWIENAVRGYMSELRTARGEILSLRDDVVTPLPTPSPIDRLRQILQDFVDPLLLDDFLAELDLVTAEEILKNLDIDALVGELNRLQVPTELRATIITIAVLSPNTILTDLRILQNLANLGRWIMNRFTVPLFSILGAASVETEEENRDLHNAVQQTRRIFSLLDQLVQTSPSSPILINFLSQGSPQLWREVAQVLSHLNLAGYHFPHLNRFFIEHLRTTYPGNATTPIIKELEKLRPQALTPKEQLGNKLRDLFSSSAALDEFLAGITEEMATELLKYDVSYLKALFNGLNIPNSDRGIIILAALIGIMDASEVEETKSRQLRTEYDIGVWLKDHWAQRANRVSFSPSMSPGEQVRLGLTDLFMTRLMQFLDRLNTSTEASPPLTGFINALNRDQWGRFSRSIAHQFPNLQRFCREGNERLQRNEGEIGSEEDSRLQMSVVVALLNRDFSGPYLAFLLPLLRRLDLVTNGRKPSDAARQILDENTGDPNAETVANAIRTSTTTR